MANNIYGAVALIGGGTGALDVIDGAGLADGDAAQVVTDAGVYYYHLNATSGASENSPLRINPDTNPGTKSWHLVGTTARIGCRVKLTSDETIADVTLTDVPWDAETYDDAAFWVIGSPTRLTIPVGVTGVLVSGCVHWSTASAVGKRLYLGYKNGGAVEGALASVVPSGVGITCRQSNISDELSVTAGDYFTLATYQNSTGNLDITAGEYTWLAIRAVRFA